MLKRASVIWLVSILTATAGHLSATVMTFYSIGAKAGTMAGAFVGRANNTTAIFYNPAGLAFQEGFGFRFNVGYYNYAVWARSEEPPHIDQNSEPQLKGSAFVAYTYKERISIGVGAFTPYSLVTKWPAQWPGDPLCLNSEIHVFTIRPALAIKINKFLAIGAALDFFQSDVRWDFHNIYSTIFGPDEEGVINELKASGNGTGFTVGVLFRPSDKFQIGGRYQQKVDLELKGKNTYGFNIITIYDFNSPEATPGLGAGRPEFYSLQKVVFSLPLPSEVVIGLMVSPTKKIAFQADIHRTGWSDFKVWEFVAENPEKSFFPDPDEEAMSDEPLEGASEGIPLDMKDTWSFKLGGEYFLRDELALRIGYARHQSPFDEENLTPVLPLLSRNVFSFGVGYDGPARSITDQSLIGNLTFDAFLQYVLLDEQTSSYPGYPLTFGGHYWVFGFGVGLYL